MARYGRRFRRGGRPRRFGGRRRARRPSAARAVVRGSFAPRQQYLKLKHAMTVYTFVENSGTAIDYGATYYLTINLGQMADPYDQGPPVYSPAAPQTTGVWWSMYPKQSVLGFNQYAQLFKRYVVNGTKVRIAGVVNYPQNVSTQVTNTVGNAWPTGALPVTYTRAYAPQSYAAFPADSLWSMMPHGKTVVCDNGKFFDKVYVKHNSLQGGIVKQHDRYVRDWTDTTGGAVGPPVVGSTDAAGAYANLLLYCVLPTPTTTGFGAGYHAHAQITLRIELTYYVTAQVLYAHEGLSPEMAMFAKALTVPTSEAFGSAPPPPSMQLAAAAAGELTGLESQQAVGRIPKRSFTD